jgi:hypothetical protein
MMQSITKVPDTKNRASRTAAAATASRFRAEVLEELADKSNPGPVAAETTTAATGGVGP